MKILRPLVALLGLCLSLAAVSGCESTSMHSTSAGKDVQVEDTAGDPKPQVSPVYLTPY